jgi:quinohemoprotein amine dehydrogenase
MIRHRPYVLTAVVCLIGAGRVLAQGIPVTDPLVTAKCGSCHKSDERGNMERVSWSRTTPEGWQAVLRDMILAHGMNAQPEEARSIVKYLSTAQGLAPEEARPVLYDAERRLHEETNIPSDRMKQSCGRCHAFARALSWRRSEGEWKQFLDSHAVKYKVKTGETAEALEFFTKAAPLHTPEWDGWKKQSMEGLAGRWLVTASLAGHGLYYGEAQVERAGEDGLNTRVSLTSVKDGSKIVRSSRSVAYAGSAWRGRSKGDGATGPDDPRSEALEVMWFAADQKSGEGRWFWGQYQEFGFDVRFQRAPGGDTPVLLLSDRAALKAGSRGNRIRLIGENLPHAAAGDLKLGAGVTVTKLVAASATEITADVDVAAGAQPGRRDITLGRASLPGAIAVYDRIDYLEVSPESAVASFGDRARARGYQPFTATAYQRGPDGLLHTADDLDLGPIDVSWELQVFHAPDGSKPDNVGTMTEGGLLVPAEADPNLNFDTWVIATARDEKGPGGDPLVGKAYVVMAVPTYSFAGRQWVRDLDRWVDDGPARTPGTGRGGLR